MQNNELLNENKITDYLREHPQFFEHHPTLLAEMYLPSLHGNGAVSLAERQQLAQRDRIRVLETKLSDLLKFGEENDAISDKVHRLSLGLLATQNFDILLQLLTHNLREDFQVPHVGVRLWANPKSSEHSKNAVFEPVDSELSNWAQNLVTPYCGHNSGLDLGSWFGSAAAPKSFALVALRGEKVFGLLAMASEEEQRFYPEMGTLYLKRIGELLSAALLRYID